MNTDPPAQRQAPTGARPVWPSPYAMPRADRRQAVRDMRRVIKRVNKAQSLPRG